MPTNTETGDAFRDDVMNLLRVAGYEPRCEFLEAHKKSIYGLTGQNLGNDADTP